MAKFDPCGIVFLKQDKVYKYDFINNISTIIGIIPTFETIYNENKDIAISNEYLWVSNGDKIIEFILNNEDTPSEYEITYNRTINIDNKINNNIGISGIGLTHKDRNTLIIGGSKIWKVDISTNNGIVTPLFDLPNNSNSFGDIYYSQIKNTYFIPYVTSNNNIIQFYIGEFYENGNIVKYKEILREYYLMGKNLQSIASQYNVKISMASQMLSSARDKLKTQLEKNQIN